MKNNKMTYILLTSAIIIWAFISFKIYEFIKESDVNLEHVEVIGELKTKGPDYEERYRLLVNYNDPFFRNTKGNILSVKTHNNNNNIPAVDHVEPDINNVIYSGMIENSKSRNKIGILLIDSTTYMVKEGVIIEDLKVGKISKESIIITRSGRKFQVDKRK